MHTDHSHDCATPVEVLFDDRPRTRPRRNRRDRPQRDLRRPRSPQTGARRDPTHPVKVIVAEEVKTADQGEVIGLFIEEKIPRGLTLQETVAEIKRQGGLVYVPHPFDRMHSVPDYEHLLTDPRRHRRNRGLQPPRRDRRLQRGGLTLRGQVPDRRRGRLRFTCGPGPRLGANQHARLRRARQSSCNRSATPTSSHAPPASSTYRP